MDNFQITEDFDLYQLTGSRDHPELVQANREYFIQEPYLTRLRVATEFGPQQIQDELKAGPYSEKMFELVVLNGGRYPKLNEAVGGAPLSQHQFRIKGDGAFDFYVPGMDIFEVEHIIRWRLGLAFHQLRVYKWDYKLKRGNFIHFGMPLGWNDMRIDYPYGGKGNG